MNKKYCHIIFIFLGKLFFIILIIFNTLNPHLWVKGFKFITH